MVLLAALAVACGGRGASSLAHGETLASPVVRPYVDRSVRPAVAVSEESFEVTAGAALPAPPDGAACVIRGSGRPRPSCGDSPLLVSEHKSGRRPLARVTPGGFPISWGFFKDTERAWVHAEARGVTLSGFTATAEETFSSRGEVPVLLGHAWVKGEAPIRVRRAVEDGVVSVSVRGDFDGVDALAWNVSCDLLGYDPAPRRPTALRRSSDQKRLRAARPRGRRLHIHAAPGETAFGTLAGAGDSLYLPLDVVEVLGDWSRVRFDTYHMRFDVWVRSAEIEAGGGGSIGSFMGQCALGTPLPGSKERATLIADTPLGLLPSESATSRALTIAAGTEVVVDARKSGFAKVIVAGPITPPPGASFLLPESVLATSPR